MRTRYFRVACATFFTVSVIFSACTKFDTTTLGADLVAVDNVNTFADTLSIVTTQGIFNDSSTVSRFDNHALGSISNDPLFGTTQASVYVQLKPVFYPFYFANPGDTIISSPGVNVGIDSVVLCLAYVNAWGDTSSSAIPQRLEVRRIQDPEFRDSVNKLRNIKYQPAALGPVLGSINNLTPQLAAAKKVFANGKDSTENQIRIKLDATFAQEVFGYDTTSTGINNAFLNDSLFRRKINGFAITSSVAGGGNSLFYVTLADLKTRLEVHYRKTRNGVKTTEYQSFQMYPAATTTALPSSTGNNVIRNYAGTPVLNPGTNHVYLQASPGTFATLNILGLADMPNRIIHRAFLVAEQDPFDVATDNIYTAPSFMFLDLRDNATPEKYKPLYFDYNPASNYFPDQNTFYFPFANVDPNYFGGRALQRTDGTGNYTRYEINITRYVQKLVTNHDYNYQLRLYAPYYITYPQYGPTQISGLGSVSAIPFYNSLARGRVRLGSGSNPAHRMRLIVIYSKV